MTKFVKTWWQVILWAIIIAIFSTVLPAQPPIKLFKKPVIDLNLSINNETGVYKPFAWPKANTSTDRIVLNWIADGNDAVRQELNFNINLRKK